MGAGYTMNHVMKIGTLWHSAVLALFLQTAGTQAQMVVNGGFESGMNGWRAWSRTSGGISVQLDSKNFHSGQSALRLQHTGLEDWSLEPTFNGAVKPGDLIDLECWVRMTSEGEARLCAAMWDAAGKNVAWSAGERRAAKTPEWQLVKTRIVIPANVARMQPRLIGHGKVELQVDDYAVTGKGNLLALRPANLPGELTLRNAALEVSFNTTNATLSVLDRKAGRTWTQRPFATDCILKTAAVKDGRLLCSLYHGGTGLDISATMQLNGARPELTVELAAQGEMTSTLRFPHPFAGQPGDYLVVPMNEGISYPVDDPTIQPMSLIAYGGHGICMGFYGVTDGVRGQMAILESQDDVTIRIERVEGRLAIVPQWDPQRQQFGYTRKLRYVFFDQGGHVAMAKRYRAHAKQTGLLKTLAEKRQFNPNVDQLIGAVNVWCWDKDSLSIVRDMKAAGMDRILWSNRQSAENLKALNALDVLTSRYDIYQDVMAATNFPRLRYIHSDWTTNAWPKDIILDRNGRWIPGWGVEARDGTMISCGVICDKQALPYARERMPAELATHPYHGRFIDTTTAAPWHECYHPDHPMTRTESKQAKMALLRYVSEDSKLVTGCETGHDASVPYLHFFEGMMSLGPYRVPDSGRKMQVIWTNVPPNVAKFQLGHDYRLPLWELVYHDCVVSYWYWGDYNNKLPALWDKRDLFNILYGVPPMFMFDKRYYEQNRARFVQSYQNTCPTIRKIGYQEMTDHRFLTQDRAVQQTAFANGTVVTVNFGNTPYTLPGGEVVKAMGFRVKE